MTAWIVTMKERIGLRAGSGPAIYAATAMAIMLAFGMEALGQDAGWPTYGNDPGGMRYSTAKQINRENVQKLTLAWSYRTGALDEKTNLIEKAAFEATPILVEGKLFLSTPLRPRDCARPEEGDKDMGIQSQGQPREELFGGDFPWSFGMERSEEQAGPALRIADFCRYD